MASNISRSARAKSQKRNTTGTRWADDPRKGVGTKDIRGAVSTSDLPADPLTEEGFDRLIGTLDDSSDPVQVANAAGLGSFDWAQDTEAVEALGRAGAVYNERFERWTVPHSRESILRGDWDHEIGRMFDPDYTDVEEDLTPDQLDTLRGYYADFVQAGSHDTRSEWASGTPQEWELPLDPPQAYEQHYSYAQNGGGTQGAKYHMPREQVKADVRQTLTDFQRQGLIDPALRFRVADTRNGVHISVDVHDNPVYKTRVMPNPFSPDPREARMSMQKGWQDRAVVPPAYGKLSAQLDQITGQYNMDDSDGSIDYSNHVQRCYSTINYWG